MRFQLLRLNLGAQASLAAQRDRRAKQHKNGWRRCRLLPEAEVDLHVNGVRAGAGLELPFAHRVFGGD
jgi:hypothetical protein